MQWFMIFCTFIGSLVCLALGTLAIGALLIRKGDNSNSVYTAKVYIVSWCILLLISSCVITWELML